MRQAHYSEISRLISATSSHGLKLVVGDFNARIHKQLPGEEDVFGQYCFGRLNYEQDHNSNRELLVEACVATGMCVANTFIKTDPERQITYHDIGQKPAGNISHTGFAQMDLFLAPPGRPMEVQ